jgi:hypothetical protein
MPLPKSPPTFAPRELKVGLGYYVLVTWPDGRPQHINGFKSEAAALAWIESKSQGWLEQNSASN